MKGVPPEIDDLMWRLAEEGSVAARSEFEVRHTRYAPELARRIRMVAELRQAGRSVSHRPTFTPRSPKVAPTPRWALGAVLGMAVLAIGAVAYVVASGGERTPVTPVVRQEAPAPVVIPTPTEVPVPTPRPNPIVVPSQGEVESTEKPSPERTPDYRKPRDFRIAETDLTAAIRLIAAGSGLDVTLAPGFQNRTVSLDYKGLSPIDILKAMGEQYGFTVLEEEEGHVLVVPARDPTTSERRVGP